MNTSQATMPFHARIFTCTSLGALLLLTGCPGTNGAGDTNGGKSNKPTKPAETVVFKRITAGLPSETVAYVGTSDFGIVGAGDANKVYYAVLGAQTHEVYATDLTSLTRTKVTDVKDMIPESLMCSPDGQRLAYTRQRKISSYLDKPGIKEPADLAIIYTYDVAKGEEQALFDFREGDWLRYRSAGIIPKMSYSGKRIAALTFDIDIEHVMRDLDEFTQIAAEYFGPASTLDESLRDDAEARMREIIDAPHVLPLLRARGIQPAAGRKVSDLDLEAVRAVLKSYTEPRWALLLKDEGEPKLLELKLPAHLARNPLDLLAVGDNVVLLQTQGKSTSGFPKMDILKVDETSGEVSEFVSYHGVASSLLLDPSGQNLRLTYLNYDPEAKALSSVLLTRTIPLDNPEGATEVTQLTAVPDTFAATQDGNSYVAQDALEHALHVSRDGGKPVKIAEFLAPVDGLFITNDAGHVAYTTNGFLFAIKVDPQGAESKDWIGTGHFAGYQQQALEFLTKLGYQPPAGVTGTWEESDGLELHEVAGLLTGAGQSAENAVLVRINAKDERIESVFFTGEPWPNPNLPRTEVDAPEAESRAQTLRAKAGWLSPEAEKYQPGPNPLFDGRAQTYVLVYRDGFLVDTPKGEKLAVNGEATLRVHKPTGQILELNLQTMPKVSGTFEADDNEIAFAVRNKGKDKYPDKADVVKIDTADMGLIVARNKKTRYAPAKLEIPTDWRLAWTVNAYIMPEEELISTSWIDVENTDMLGQLNFLPTNQAGNL
jgi:hypothetical protein